MPLKAEYPYGSAPLWLCVLMSLCPYGSAPLWLCALMAMCPYGSVSLWLYALLPLFHMGLRPYGYVRCDDKDEAAGPLATKSLTTEMIRIKRQGRKRRSR